MSPTTMLREVTRKAGGATLIAATAFAAAACGGDTSGSTGPNSGQARYYLTAYVDGVGWAEDAASASATGARLTSAGSYTISGYDAASQSTIIISLTNIRVPGPIPLALVTVKDTNPSGTAQISNLSAGWSTVGSGGGGTVVVTTLTSTEIIGSFSFIGKGVLNASSSKEVTAGKFDLPVK